ncbi:hypothetical protein SAMN04487891_10793 [Flagellimonas taeanensis]|jgi:hypothetical protein|uniref:Uncharacterized protein n=1 Tax=Flagellimonas taeanensis TaxID=1005926 RepID=A0A1M6V6Y0_9FLAO|nr:hypothetical protein SAMN04487891_10793 [Allomuricauda taeanensis]SHK77066.1 hypothetical protein SAMN05216293_1913 [Allomuricauda taeanensis]
MATVDRVDFFDSGRFFILATANSIAPFKLKTMKIFIFSLANEMNAQM